MDGKLKIDLNTWISETKEKMRDDLCYSSSYHINQLIECEKDEWLSLSLQMMSYLKDLLRNNDELIVVLIITLNRSRSKNNSKIEFLNDIYFKNTYTPPEIFINNIKCKDCFTYIKNNAKYQIAFSDYPRYTVYYTEKWDHGFDRWLTIISYEKSDFAIL